MGLGGEDIDDPSHKFLPPLVLHQIPTLVHRFNLNEEPPASPDVCKKRKLPNKQGGSPLTKFKFRDRVCGLDDESSTEDNIEMDDGISFEGTEETQNIHNLPGCSANSEKDSNSFEAIGDTSMMLDVRRKTGISSRSICCQDEDSTSLGSCNGDVFRSVLYSLDSRSPNIKQKAVFGAKVEGKVQVLPEFDDHLDFEVFNTGSLTSESESSEILPLEDVKIKDMMLYSNDVFPNASVLTSETGKPVIHKQTIDQEFEQYFSMLML